MNAEIISALAEAIPQAANSMAELAASPWPAPSTEDARQRAIRMVAECSEALAEENLSLNSWLGVHLSQSRCLALLQKKLIAFDAKNSQSMVWHNVQVPSDAMRKLNRVPDNELKYQETHPILKIEEDARQRAKQLMLARFKTAQRMQELESALRELEALEPSI